MKSHAYTEIRAPKWTSFLRDKTKRIQIDTRIQGNFTTGVALCDNRIAKRKKWHVCILTHKATRISSTIPGRKFELEKNIVMHIHDAYIKHKNQNVR